MAFQWSDILLTGYGDIDFLSSWVRSATWGAIDIFVVDKELFPGSKVSGNPLMCCEGIYVPSISFLQDLEKGFLSTVDIVKLISKKIDTCYRSVMLLLVSHWLICKFIINQEMKFDNLLLQLF